MKGIIEITGYHNKVVDGKIQWFAVDKKNNEYPMPEQFASMCNEKHLAIKKVRYDIASVLDLPQEEVYIPLRTDLS